MIWHLLIELFSIKTIAFSLLSTACTAQTLDSLCFWYGCYNQWIHASSGIINLLFHMTAVYNKPNVINSQRSFCYVGTENNFSCVFVRFLKNLGLIFRTLTSVKCVKHNVRNFPSGAKDLFQPFVANLPGRFTVLATRKKYEDVPRPFMKMHPKRCRDTFLNSLCCIDRWLTEFNFNWKWFAMDFHPWTVIKVIFKKCDIESCRCDNHL